MDILVKHGTTNISSYIISYTREHNICTGIGTLELVLSSTYSTTINPHDAFSVYENGDFKVKYYVSDVSDNAPDGTIRLQCQDRSKYLVDYFISEQYTIDYPSYTRYWIETFFEQAGISYSFTTDSPGNLLSNYTVLGLQPAYDQIMMLCQMSGWYFYFDGNGTAIIGSLETDISSAGSVNKRDILDIKKTIDDKMLRNRAVVWGGYDPLRHQNSYASVTVHTPYNYDSRDIRTMVVSNNNIPNLASAYDIANILIKEFAKPTIVKEITIWGARNYNLGEMLRVSSDVWKGRGLITTLSVSMDKTGLVTKVLLDERCPRLFGFFNFGDYVYVGTWGDGVWKKHIKFDPTWYNFSSGLTNLNISDLHINNGVFGAVGENGEMYYALYEEPWHEIPISELALESSSTNVVSSGAGGGIEGSVATFSGLHSRAVIIDKTINTAKYAIDNYSGLNTGDYFLYSTIFSGFTTSSGNFPTSSGVSFSGIINSGSRAWILEYDVLNGDTVGTPYPISYSGEYAFMVLDIENDGRNDYVSVVTSGGVGVGGSYDFGKHINTPTILVSDTDSKVVFSPFDLFDLEGQSYASTLVSTTSLLMNTCVSIFDNEVVNEKEIVWFFSTGSTNRKLRRLTITNPYDPLINRPRVTSTTLESPTMSSTLGQVICINKTSNNTYDMFHTNIGYTNGGSYVTSAPTLSLSVRTWNTTTNTVSADTSLASLAIPNDPNKGASEEKWNVLYRVINKKIYLYCRHEGNRNVSRPGDPGYENYVEIYSVECDVTSRSTTSGLLHRENFNSADGTDAGNWDSTVFDVPWVFQNGTTPAIVLFCEQRVNNNVNPDYTTYIIYSPDGTTFQAPVQIQHTNTLFPGDPDYLYYAGLGDGSQLTSDKFLVYCWRNAGNQPYYFFNGQTVTIGSMSSVPFQWQWTNIYPVFGGSKYIAKNGSDFYYCNPVNGSTSNIVSFPANYTVYKPFTNYNSAWGYYYWYVRNNDLSQDQIAFGTNTAPLGYLKPFSGIGFSSARRGFIAGNFFVDYDESYDTAHSSNYLRIMYLDNSPILPNGYRFLVLQRDNEDFHLIQESTYPMRADISLSSPLITIGSGSDTFKSNFVYDNELVQVVPVPNQNLQVRDYRYTLLETASGMDIVSSGAGVQTQVVFVTSEGIYSGSADTYSGGFMLMTSQPSTDGLLERIETTNYTYPGEFIFVTTSGLNPEFWQKDNDKLVFVSYSGLPPSRATIIRVDDYL